MFRFRGIISWLRLQGFKCLYSEPTTANNSNEEKKNNHITHNATNNIASKDNSKTYTNNTKKATQNHLLSEQRLKEH